MADNSNKTFDERKVGRKSSSTRVPINHTITTIPKNDENSKIGKERKYLIKNFFLKKCNISCPMYQLKTISNH